jgi:uncharacterized protein with PIN domain
MRRYLFLILVGLVFLAGLSGCCHWPGQEGYGWAPEKRVDYLASKIKSELDLNEDQNSKLSALANEVKSVFKQSSSKDFKSEIKALIEDPSLDVVQVKSMIQKKREATNARFDSNFDRIFPKLKAFHDSLTPEQRKKAAEAFEKYSGRWENHS